MDRRRILTNRAFPSSPGAYEAIEVVERDGKELFDWRAVEGDVECCFPVPMDFVIEVFARCGRTYRPSGREAYRTVEEMFGIQA